jgi:acetyltransferase-like isoleucine patch superfamily enzyme/dTDP-4-dehydrorhamnose 3,5-epimerase-like enzyme
LHELAVVESKSVGSGTRIWAFAHILPGAVIGRDCNICDHTFIENDVVIGDRVTIKCGVQVWDVVRLEDDVFVGPNATFTNDPFPRSRAYLSPDRTPRTIVKRGASIGANATILPGLTVGDYAMVGAGAVVTRDVPPKSIVVGNPARITGYCGAENTRVDQYQVPPTPGVTETSVNGVSVHKLPSVVDLRGSLSFAEAHVHVPFDIRRYFLIFSVPSSEVRGEHAHKTVHQFLVCVSGSCHVVADDGKVRQEFTLDDPTVGLYLPPLIWGVQYKYSQDAVLLVLTSAPYDAGDYIRDYSEFLTAVAG